MSPTAAIVMVPSRAGVGAVFVSAVAVGVVNSCTWHAEQIAQIEDSIIKLLGIIKNLRIGKREGIIQ